MKKKEEKFFPLEATYEGNGIMLDIDDIDKIVPYKKNNLVIEKGQTIKNLLILTKGMAQYIMEDNNKEIGLRIFFAPCIINDIRCIETPQKGKKVHRSIKMRSIGEVAYINLKSLSFKFKDFDNIILPILEHLIFLNRQTNNMIEIIPFDCVKKKVGKFLILLAEERGKINNGVVKIYDPPNSRELSKMLNISKQTISRILKIFKEKKLFDKTFNNYELLNYAKWKSIFKV